MPRAGASTVSSSVYLSGEIHSQWREEIQHGADAAGLDITFTAPVTDHPASDAAGDHPVTAGSAHRSAPAPGGCCRPARASAPRR
ncbi:MAG: YtoQ family protein [Brachybacterium sp.]